MQQTAKTPSKNWKRDAMKRAGVISDAFEVFKAWLAHFANWILFFCLIGNILQTVVSLGSELSGTLLCIQCVMLDVAGASLYTMSQHAKSEGNEKGAHLAMNMSIILMIIMTVTALNGTLNAIFPALSWLVQDVNYALIFARIVIVVAYVNIVHQLNTSTEMHDNRIEELEQEVSTLNTELNTCTAELDTYRVRVDTQTQELNRLRVQVDTNRNNFTLQIDALRVQLEHKDQQIEMLQQSLESGTKLHESNAELIVQGVQSQLNTCRTELDKERQRVSTLTAELDDVRVQLNTRTAELDRERKKVSTLNTEQNSRPVQVDTYDNVIQLRDESEAVSFETAIRELIQKEPTLLGREIARRVGCSPATACNWKKRIEKERKEA